MKKLFLIITLFGFLFAACGGSPSTETKKDDVALDANSISSDLLSSKRSLESQEVNTTSESK